MFAILLGLEKCRSTIRLSIYTDSQNAIKFIKLFNTYPSERNILKIDDYPIVEKINHEMKRFEIRPEIFWVKGHEGDENNHLVHILAQSACRDFEIPPTDITPFKNGLALQRDLHLYHQLEEEDPDSNYRTDTYPRTFFKNKFSLFLLQSNIDKLNHRWDADCPVLNTNNNRDMHHIQL